MTEGRGAARFKLRLMGYSWAQWNSNRARKTAVARFPDVPFLISLSAAVFRSKRGNLEMGRCGLTVKFEPLWQRIGNAGDGLGSKTVKFGNRHKLPALHKALPALPRTPLIRKLILHVNVLFALSRSIFAVGSPSRAGKRLSRFQPFLLIPLRRRCSRYCSARGKGLRRSG